MNRILTSACSLTAAAMLTVGVAAQTPPPQPPPPTPQARPETKAPPSTTTQAGQSVKLIGCIQSESDFRAARDQGRGGAAGTGIGAGNEFVLVNASMATQGLGPSAGTADPAYELTGANESKAKEFVGKRVEITGTLKPAEMAGGAPTGGATAGKPPSGVDVASKDLKLRELEVTTVTATTGTCTP